MSNKIIASTSDEKTGFSRVTIQNKYGHFTGTAFFNPDEDISTFSHYAGERYAENRAYAKFAKFRYEQEKIKLKTIQNLVHDLEVNNCLFEYIPKKISRRINLKLRDYSQSVENWKNLYLFMEDKTKEEIKQREKILKKYPTSLNKGKIK